MANQGINHLATGLGYIYAATPNEDKVLVSWRNTIQGARDARRFALVNSPIAANRSAIATITVTAAAAAGNLISITINGVNQIAGNVACASTDEAVVAATWADAINAFTPASGPDYTASVNGAVISVFGPAASGSTPNGVLPVISTSVGSLTATATAFSGGSFNRGVIDDVTGIKFWLDADYGPTGMAGSLAALPSPILPFLYAIEITEYLTNRGLQAGLQYESLTTNAGGISFQRFSAIATLDIDTEGMVPTDNLEYINPTGFSEGDILKLHGVNDARVVTIVSRTNATEVAEPNIILSNNISYGLSGTGSGIELQFTNDPTLGPVFIENSRTFNQANGYIIYITYSAMAILITNGTVSVGAKYMITDRADAGIIVSGSAVNALELAAEGNFYNADYQKVGDYSGIAGYPVNGQYGIWDLNYGGVAAANRVVIWNNLHYNNTTGVDTGVNPATDTTNFTVLTKSPTNGYIFVTDKIEYDFENDWIQKRIDTIRGNNVGGSFAYEQIASNGFNVITKMQWGNDNCISNQVTEALLDCLNNPGTTKGNVLLPLADIKDTTWFVGCDISNNFLASYGRIESNIFSGAGSISQNRVYSRLISSNDIGAGASIIENDCYGNVSGNTLAAGASITKNNISGSGIGGNVLAAGAFISNNYNLSSPTGAGINTNTLGAGAKIDACTLTLNGSIDNKTLSAAVILSLNLQRGFSTVGTVTASLSGYRTTNTGTLPISVTVSGTTVTLSTLQSTDYDVFTFTAAGATATVNTLAVPPSGVFRIQPAAGKTITISGSAAPGSAGKFVGPVASWVLVGDNSDCIYLENIGGVLFWLSSRISI